MDNHYSYENMNGITEDDAISLSIINMNGRTEGREPYSINNMNGTTWQDKKAYSLNNMCGETD